MSKAAVVYWSATGNTEAMANAVADGRKGSRRGSSGSDSRRLLTRQRWMSSMQLRSDALLWAQRNWKRPSSLRCSSACESKLSGKKIALFGSYGWGDGEWMRLWEETCKNDGAVLACESVMANETPDAEAEAACEALGKALA